MDSEAIDTMKLCLSNRYDASTKSLNVSHLNDDQGMFRPEVPFAPP